MNASPVEASVPPNPSLTKAIGVLNVFFGTLLFLCGLGCLNPLAPSLIKYEPFRIERGEAQELYEQYHDVVIRKLEAREQAAKTEAEKAPLRREIVAERAKHPNVAKQLDWTAFNHDLVWLSWYLWGDVVTGPILNLFMLASGIGLLQLRSWARTMALWVAALKLIRLVVLTVLLLVFVNPHATKALGAFNETDLGKTIQRWSDLARDDYRDNPTEPSPWAQINPQELYQALRMGGGTQVALFFLFLGAVYPVATLIVLIRPSTKAACVAVDEPEPEPQ